MTYYIIADISTFRWSVSTEYPSNSKIIGNIYLMGTCVSLIATISDLHSHIFSKCTSSYKKRIEFLKIHFFKNSNTFNKYIYSFSISQNISFFECFINPLAPSYKQFNAPNF